MLTLTNKQNLISPQQPPHDYANMAEKQNSISPKQPPYHYANMTEKFSAMLGVSIGWLSENQY